jgi:HK97 family phage major capsid protein
MNLLRNAQKNLQAKLEEAKELQAADSLTDEQKARVACLPDEIRQARAEVEQAKSLAGLSQDAEQYLHGAGSIPSIASGAMDELTSEEKFRQVRKARTKARFFSLVEPDRAKAQEAAHRFGMFALASMGRKSALKWCKDNGIPIMSAGQVEGINEDGGFLVPEEFDSQIVDLREQFGVFRRYARNSPMTRDTKNRPRRASGLTAYFVGEGEAATESKKGWDRVNLTAKKIMVLTKFSSEIGEDAAIEVGDDLAGEIAYAFAKKEDQCGFIGTGTSTYGGIVGATQRLLDVYTTTGGVGLILGAGNTFAELVLSDFNKVAGALPEYAETPNVAWFCHKTFFESVMVKLAMAAGGVTLAEITQGARRQFMGYPVVVSQVMPKTDANGQVPVIFGDLSLAADLGDRRQTTIAMSEHSEFDTDEIGVRGTERFDINVHSVGDSTDAGPVVGLVMASS